jgi:hypothetical protein
MEQYPITQIDEPLPYSIMEEYVDEQWLTEQVDNLWANRESYSRCIQSQRDEVHQMETTLSEMLFTMKTLLSKPGRGGGWSAWLKHREIPRATADRMVSRYVEAKGLPGNRLTESTRFLPPDAEVSRLTAAVWPRIERSLHSPLAHYLFLQCLADRAELQTQLCPEGVLVFNPDRVPEPTPAPVVGDSAEDDDAVL